MSKQKQKLRIIDAPMYRYWQALYLAFYSSRLYIDVAKRWRGYGILYLLLVITITTIPLSLRVLHDFNRYFDEQLIAPLEQLPPLYLQNGKVVFDKTMPYHIKNKAGEVTAIVDTTAKVAEINEAYPQLTVLITKDKIYFRPPKLQLFFTVPTKMVGAHVYIQPLNSEMNEVFVGKQWVASSGILKLKWIVDLLVYPLMIASVFGMSVILLLFFAFIGQLLSIIVFKFKLKFKEACRLFLVSSTAEILVFMILLTANATPPGGGFFSIALLSVYFSYAVLSVRRESNKMVFA